MELQLLELALVQLVLRVQLGPQVRLGQRGQQEQRVLLELRARLEQQEQQVRPELRARREQQVRLGPREVRER